MDRPAPAPRLHFLDALRGIAAVAVLVDHVSYWALRPAFDTINAAMYPGPFGVLLFFLISGFIIPRSLDRAGSLGHFWIGRACRLWPLYLVALAPSIIWRAPSYPGREIPVALANLIPAQELFGWPNLVSNSWTLAFELAFYGLLSLAYATRLRRRPVAMAVAALLLALAVEGGGLWARAFGGGWWLPRPNSLIYIATMFAGVVISRWHAGEVSGRACARVCALLVATFLLTVPPWAPQVAITRLAVLGTFAVAFRLRHRAVPRPLLWLGRGSYSLYLLHGVVLMTVPQTGHGALTAALWVALSLALAPLGERWVERPGVALGKRLLGRRAAIAMVPGHRPLPTP